MPEHKPRRRGLRPIRNMTNYFVRWDTGSDANDGLSRETPKKYLSSVMNDSLAVGGDLVFVAGQLVEVGTDRTFYGGATPDNPIYVFGLDDTAWATGSGSPAASELVVDRFDANIPSYETTANNGDFFLRGYAKCWGLKLLPSQSIQGVALVNVGWTFEQCILRVANTDSGGQINCRDEKSDNSLNFIDTDIEFPNTTTYFQLNSGIHTWRRRDLDRWRRHNRRAHRYATRKRWRRRCDRVRERRPIGSGHGERSC